MGDKVHWWIIFNKSDKNIEVKIYIHKMKLEKNPKYLVRKSSQSTINHATWFFFSFFSTVPQYNQEHMSIDNMHNESVGIFVSKMACDIFSHFQNRAIQLHELIWDQEKHAFKLTWKVMFQRFKINETNKQKMLSSNYKCFNKKDYANF